MSHSMVPLNILSALRAAQKFLGGERSWKPVTTLQKGFLDSYAIHSGALEKFSDKELRTWADTNAANLNAILKKNSFNIMLRDFAKGEFGVVSILDVLVLWLRAGRVTQITNGGTRYPAVEFKDRGEVDGKMETLFTGLRSPEHKHPIARLTSRSGDTVYMTVATEEAKSFSLMSRINSIRRGPLRATDHEYLTFPMVDYDKHIDISWLLRLLSIPDGAGVPYEIAQAVQQTKFKMNEHGARVKDAVAIGMRMTSFKPPRPRIVIDEPFYLWIERKDVPIPILYGYFDQENWKNPGDLAKM